MKFKSYNHLDIKHRLISYKSDKDKKDEERIVLTRLLSRGSSILLIYSNKIILKMQSLLRAFENRVTDRIPFKTVVHN